MFCFDSFPGAGPPVPPLTQRAHGRRGLWLLLPPRPAQSSAGLLCPSLSAVPCQQDIGEVSPSRRPQTFPILVERLPPRLRTVFLCFLSSCTSLFYSPGAGPRGRPPINGFSKLVATVAACLPAPDTSFPHVSAASLGRLRQREPLVQRPPPTATVPLSPGHPGAPAPQPSLRGTSGFRARGRTLGDVRRFPVRAGPKPALSVFSPGNRGTRQKWR